jgi:hypothetical protein
VVVSYFKHDENDNTQAYVARFENGKWNIQVVSDWQGKHIFKGGGSGPSTFGTSLRVSAVQRHADGRLALPFRHWKAGSGLIVIDEASLKPIEVVAPPERAKRYPDALTRVTSDFPGMGVRWRGESGSDRSSDTYYALRWETLGSNRDRPRKGPLPENSDLVLYKFRHPAE